MRNALLTRLVPRACVAVVPLLLATGCLSSMREVDGHRVFNPLFLPYLESSSRDRWQKPEEVLSALQIGDGDVVADIGAGGGYFTERIANRVGPSGHVYAVDVQDAMIRALSKRVRKRSLTNVTVLRGEFDDPCLPPASCDLAFFSSVYKEIDGREDYMGKVRAALKEGGRVAILEYRPEGRGPGPPRDSRLPAEQVQSEMEEAGFRLRTRFEFLSREYFLVFEKRSGRAGRGGARLRERAACPSVRAPASSAARAPACAGAWSRAGSAAS